MRALLKITLVAILMKCSSCFQKNFMDYDLIKPKNMHILDAEFCNPLYWLPKTVPENCTVTTEVMRSKRDAPHYPMPMNPMQGYPMPMAMPFPTPLQPVPYGVPMMPQGPMIPVGPQPYPQFPMPFPPQPYFPRPLSGFIPGLPGLVSSDGGVNIMPFSDVYSDVYEKHKQKKMMKEMEKILKKYDRGSWSRNYRRRLYH